MKKGTGSSTGLSTESSADVSADLSAVGRRSRMQEMLQEHGQITVKEMSVKFGVSEMTIRRDLHRMEEQGVVTVHYGGATLRNAHSLVQDFAVRQDKLYQNKLCIARMAAGYVKEGDILFLDTSTTVLLMMRFLPDVHLTIVTNSLPVMEEAYKNHKIRLYMAPGIYQEKYGGSMDFTTAEYVSSFHYDKAFLGAAAVDAQFGASSEQEIEGAVKKHICKNAEETYLLADHTKFGQKNLIRYLAVEEYRCIFTDDEIDDEQKKQIAMQGGNLIVCI